MSNEETYRVRAKVHCVVKNGEVYAHLGNVLDYLTQHKDGNKAIERLDETDEATLGYIDTVLGVIIETLWQYREKFERGEGGNIHVSG